MIAVHAIDTEAAFSDAERQARPLASGNLLAQERPRQRGRDHRLQARHQRGDAGLDAERDRGEHAAEIARVDEEARDGDGDDLPPADLDALRIEEPGVQGPCASLEEGLPIDAIDTAPIRESDRRHMEAAG